MYLQYRIINNTPTLIQVAEYSDTDVDRIVSGIYEKQKTNKIELFKKYIFKTLSNDDIIIKSNSILYKPIYNNGTVREMTREEICATGDLSILIDGEYFENGKIIKVEYNQDLGYLKPTWYRELKQWLEGATDLEKVQAQISEYSELDTPSTLKEMGTELANECTNMLIELRNMAYTLGNPATIEDRDLPIFPKPSAKLKAFKDKFNSIR